MLLCSGDLGASGDASVDVGDARDNGPPAEKPPGRTAETAAAQAARRCTFSLSAADSRRRRTDSKLGRALRGCRPSDPWLGRK